MRDRTILITGANKGIGYETARQLGREGARIWLGSRDPDRGQGAAARLAAEGIEVRAVTLDVTSDASVAVAVTEIERADAKLDVLINNAGISGLQTTAPSEQPLDDIRTIYETNVFAPIRVTRALLPLLKAAGDASVIMVSSGLGSLGWLSDPANPFYGINILGYNSSKTALNAVTVSLAKELSTFGVRVKAADPGYTATDFNGHSGYRSVEEAAAGIAWLANQQAGSLTGRFYFEQQEVPW